MTTTPEETGPHPLAARLAAYLQRPDDPDTLALAEAHLPIVESFVHGYTRGRGWDEGTGRPAAPLESVIISATARLTANPEQVSAYAVGDYSERPAALAGWTLPELAVLHRYRRRTNRGTTAKEADAVQQLNAELLAPYAKTTDVVESLSSYATLADLVSLVTEAELAAALDALPAPPDLSGYALKTDIPEEPDLSGYALKTELHEPPDLSGYALASEVPGVTVDRTSGVRVFLGDPGGDVLLFGDTGWRNITGELASGSAYRVMLRRVGQSVFLEVENWLTPSAGASNIYVLPNGWKPPTNAYMPSVHGGSRGFRSWFIGTNGNVGINNAAAASESTSVRFQWATDEPWPAALPGVAA